MAGRASKRRMVVLVPPREGDSGGVLRGLTEVYAIAFAAAGLEPLLLASEDPDLPRQLVAQLAAPEVRGCYSIAGCGLQLWANEPQRAVELFDRAGKPFICHHGDHPYQAKMRNRMRVDFAAKQAWFNDPASLAFLARLGPHRAAHHHGPPAVAVRAPLRDAPLRPAAERDQKVLFVGNIASVGRTRAQLAERRPDLIASADAILAEALPDHATPVAAVAERVMAARGEAFDPGSEALQDMLTAVDWQVRHKRRQMMLAEVRRHPITVIAQADLRWPGMHPESRRLPMMMLPSVLDLCGRARAMLLPQPTYPGGLTERILFAMYQGMVVVTTPSPAIERHFVHGRDLLVVRPDYADVDDQLDLAMDDRIADEIGRNARAAVRPFLPERIVARYLEEARRAGFDL